MGRFIAIEGLDGSGKATQTLKLTEYLQKKEQNVIRITFPDYDSPSSAPLRMYLAGEIGSVEDVGAYPASSFFAVDRYISYQNHWKKQYEAGYTIISDRYTTSNAVHQMSKLPVEEWNTYIRWMEDFEYGRLDLPRPDRVIYLDMEPKISQTLLMARVEAEHINLDIHEENLGYMKNCRRAALYAAGRMDWSVIKCDDGKAPLTIDTVFEMILKTLQLDKE